ncbi:MAG: family oxidoreductase [Nocardioides sp.]|jgi:NAD(P)-dependent dehydrogenase (short-subunit alcohol dehydrogenase family)|nr:family oxidoreductase [Nocardioides sp.]
MSSEAGSITGHTVIVVGAGSGIGRAAARHFASAGANVVCADREEKGIRQLAATASDSMSAWRTDVTDPAGVDALMEHAVNRWGRIHALVNCAGITGPLGRRSHEVNEDELDATYRVNLRGAFSLTRAVLPYLLEHRYGRIAMVASIAGKEGNPNMIGYSATKAGLIGMVKAQGKEYAQDGITINALAPAVIHTPFLDTQPPEVVDYMTAKIPMGRTGTADEASTMLTWMISPACSFTTGFTFDLSGGRATY